MSIQVYREKAFDLLFSREKVDSNWLEEFRAEEDANPDWILVCEEVVRDHYRKDDAAKDGYGRIAWALKGGSGQKDALRFYVQDWEENRMGRWQFLRFVEVLLAERSVGKAGALVERYYSLYPEAKDGWAVVALYYKVDGNFKTALSLFRRDYDLGRISFTFWKCWIELEWDVGNYDTVVDLIARLYEADKSAVNLYLSYGVRAFNCGERKVAARLFLLERESIRAVPRDIVGNVWSILGAASDVGNVRGWVNYFEQYLSSRTGGGDSFSKVKLVEVLINYGWRNAAEEVLGGVDRNLSQGDARHLMARPSGVDEEVFCSGERTLTRLMEGADVDRRLVAGYVRSSINRIYRDFTFLKERIGPEERIVDVGCTPPLMLSLLKDAGFRFLTAIDPSAKQYEHFFRRLDIDFYSFGADEIPVQRLRGNIDVFCMCEVIEHLAVDVAPVLYAAKDVLQRGGKLYITTPNLRSISGLYALISEESGLASKAKEKVRDQLDRVNSNHKYYGHIREYTSKELVELVESFGFRLVEKRMSTFSLLNRKYPLFLLALEKAFPSWRLFGAYLFEKVGDFEEEAEYAQAVRTN